MITDVKELEKYPDIMSKDQFQKACHVGCRRARWLLNSGLIPCEKTGKKTRCYRVKKSDVIKFVENALVNPVLYLMPSSEGGPRNDKEEYLRFSDISRAKVEKYYRALLKNEPSILTTARVAMLTGYQQHAVLRWHEKGELRSLSRHLHPFRFPKENLIKFLASDSYNRKTNKSEVHKRMIKEIKKKYGDEKDETFNL